MWEGHVQMAARNEKEKHKTPVCHHHRLSPGDQGPQWTQIRNPEWSLSSGQWSVWTTQVSMVKVRPVDARYRTWCGIDQVYEMGSPESLKNNTLSLCFFT